MTPAAPDPEPATGLGRAAWRHRALSAFRSFVDRSDDARLERTVGSQPGLRVLFGVMAGEFRPDRAQGWTGDIQYDLRTRDGEPRPWTVRVGATSATAHRGPSPEPELVVKIGVADFVRMGAGELDAGRALLSGRLDLTGDATVALRLADMFGRPGA